MSDKDSQPEVERIFGDNVYLATLYSNFPRRYTKELGTLLDSSASWSPVEMILRFATGGSHTHILEGDEKAWESAQAKFITALRDLQKPASKKRSRNDSDHEEEAASSPGLSNGAKRQRLSDGPSKAAEILPKFTLHSISATSPVRKKVDITIHNETIQFTNPTSHAFEASVPLDSLTRAFVLPTRGKAKRHWTIVLMSSDYVEPQNKKQSGSSPKDLSASGVQIIFGIDANPTTKFETTDHTPSSPRKETHDKASDTLPSILSFLSHLPEKAKPIIQPSSAIFSSKASGGAPGIDAYRSAKAGSLWFMEQGILWGEGKPCEFWALEDLVGEGIRTISATGRTCSVYLSRRDPTPSSPNPDDDEEDPEPIETEFSMVDGKEQDPIREWVRKYKSSFGLKAGDVKGKSKANGDAAKDKGQGKAKAAADPWKSGGNFTIKDISLEDSDDEDDEDFEMSSDDDSGGGSGSESESSVEGSDSVGDGDSDTDEEGEEDGAGSEAEDEGEEEDLDPANHPLLRPGAMPKMSKAAMDMAVAMVEDAVMGKPEEEEEEAASDEQNEGESGSEEESSDVVEIPKPPQKKKTGRGRREGSDEDNEVDELED